MFGFYPLLPDIVMEQALVGKGANELTHALNCVNCGFSTHASDPFSCGRFESFFLIVVNGKEVDDLVLLRLLVIVTGDLDDQTTKEKSLVVFGYQSISRVTVTSVPLDTSKAGI